ncbi:hypothetical protein [Amycolatopsis coloradensis]|uniref:hypothetical protein n=1 Tax=Amycolatopsis coloradensis TaxID=76021 RepID=UPI001300D7B1|nr:hypothetical protein [Amycolatopsis coloradensis]
MSSVVARHVVVADHIPVPGYSDGEGQVDNAVWHTVNVYGGLNQISVVISQWPSG